MQIVLYIYGAHYCIVLNFLLMKIISRITNDKVHVRPRAINGQCTKYDIIIYYHVSEGPEI